MRKILLPSLALFVIGGGAYVFRAEFEKPEAANASARPARPHSANERALMSQQELLDAPAGPEETLIPGEFLRTVRAIPGESSIEFLARRSQGLAEGRFDRHSFEAVFDERSGKLVRVEGSIDLGSLASPSASLVESIRQGAFFGDSDKKTCVIRSVRIHSALLGQLPNRANALIEAVVTIAGVSKPVSIPVRTASNRDHGLTIEGEFMLDRAAFGLPVEPRSADSVKNELVVRLNMRAGASDWSAADNLPRQDSIPAGTSRAAGESSTKGSARGASN